MVTLKNLWYSGILIYIFQRYNHYESCWKYISMTSYRGMTHQIFLGGTSNIKSSDVNRAGNIRGSTYWRWGVSEHQLSKDWHIRDFVLEFVKKLWYFRVIICHVEVWCGQIFFKIFKMKRLYRFILGYQEILIQEILLS